MLTFYATIEKNRFWPRLHRYTFEENEHLSPYFF